MAYQAKELGVLDRQLKVQEICIPFVITHHATSTSVVHSNDAPSLLFIKTEGLDDIAGAEAVGEVAPTMSSASDSSGVSYFMVKIGEPVAKVQAAYVMSRVVDSGLNKPANILAFATGTNAAQNIYLKVTHGVNLSSTDLNGCLVVKYVIDETV